MGADQYLAFPSIVNRFWQSFATGSNLRIHKAEQGQGVILAAFHQQLPVQQMASYTDILDSLLQVNAILKERQP